jgi:hypothetical protein
MAKALISAKELAEGIEFGTKFIPIKPWKPQLVVPTERLFCEILADGNKLINDDHRNPHYLLELAVRYLLYKTDLKADSIAFLLYASIKKWRPDESYDPPFDYDEVVELVAEQFNNEVAVVRIPATSPMQSDILIGKDLEQYISAIDVKAPLIEGLISRGELVMFFAPSGTGKSSFAQSLCAYACAGQPVFELFEVSQPLKCLYINLEMADAEVGVRFEGMFESLGQGLDNFEVDTLLDFDITRQADRQRLHNTIEAKKPDIIVLDPLEAMHHRDENSASEMSFVIKPLREMTHIFNCAFIIVHHSGAPRYDNRGRLLPKRIRGSSVIEDKMDNVIEIIETDNPNTKRLHFTKARSVMTTRRQDLLFDFDWDTYLIKLTSDPELRKRYAELSFERHKKIEPLLELLKLGYGVRELARRLGVNASTIVRWHTGIREPSPEHVDKLQSLLKELE